MTAGIDLTVQVRAGNEANSKRASLKDVTDQA